MTPAEALAALGAVWSPDLDAYAAGELDASRLRCALCQHAPCDCPPFGSAAYFDLLDARHGRPRAPRRVCSAPECPMTATAGEHPAGLAVSGPDGSAACISQVPASHEGGQP